MCGLLVNISYENDENSNLIRIEMDFVKLASNKIHKHHLIRYENIFVILYQNNTHNDI